MTLDPSKQLELASSSVGGRDALSDAIAAEAPRLRRHSVYLFYNQADADDLVQDCLEVALRNKASLRDTAKLRSWLFSILNNLFLMRQRSNSRRGRALQIEEIADSIAAATSAQDRLLAHDIARAMSRLSAEHRQILLLLNVEGYGYQEIATTLNIPIGTVMSRLARARRRLRAVLEGQDLRLVD